PPLSTDEYLPAGRHSSTAGGKRLTPRNLKAAATRERIIAAAAAAFDERGYLGVNLREVVQDLGLTTGALYYFFKTKEDLAVEIVERHFAGWDDLVAEVVAHSTSRLDALVEVTYRVADAFTSDLVVRAGARLSAEREVIGAELHRPYADWTTRLAAGGPWGPAVSSGPMDPGDRSPSDDRSQVADERDRHADERDRHADERDRHA
ncbi:TetR family transcriptional regulator, partial [Acidimicrobiaceae bacterium USS-CC1]|nr:TetR family transcriptional regulator [Acidiferrimicrobium australe]